MIDMFVTIICSTLGKSVSQRPVPANVLICTLGFLMVCLYILWVLCLQLCWWLPPVSNMCAVPCVHLGSPINRLSVSVCM